MFLGVDGGGSKTAFVLIDDQGKILARHISTGAYYLQIGMEGLSTLLTNGINEVLRYSNRKISDIRYAFLGLPAYGEDSRVQSALDVLPVTILGNVPYKCGNDMVCGWAGSLGCRDGINIVAGTGSIAYGEAGGQSGRSGGWGELFSDEGSAYWLAVSGLNAFSKMSDGRLKRGPLYSLYRKEFSLKSDLDVSGFIMSNLAANRDAVAALATHVSKAAELGDAIAIGIYETAASELASMITVLGEKLPFPPNEIIRVSYSGGVFKTGNLILDPLRQELERQNKNYNLVEPLHSPDIGAALYAAKLSGTTIPSLTLY